MQTSLCPLDMYIQIQHHGQWSLHRDLIAASMCDRVPCLETPFGRPVLEKNYCVKRIGNHVCRSLWINCSFSGGGLAHLSPELPWVLKGVAEMLSGLLPQWWDSPVFRCGHPQLHFRLTIPVSLECTGPKRYKSCFHTLCGSWATDFSCGASSWKHCAYHFLNHKQLYLKNHATFKCATFTITYHVDFMDIVGQMCRCATVAFSIPLAHYI